MMSLPSQDVDVTRRKTKVICTLGPSCWDVDGLVKLLQAGMNVARLNFSHGDHPTHARSVANVRAAVAKSGIPCAILLDTKGPEIRTGKLKNGGAEIQLVQGQEVAVLADPPSDFRGDSNEISVDYKNLTKVIQPGRLIRIADGLIVLKVERVLADRVIARCQNTAMMGEHKGVNLPGTDVDLPAVSERDEMDLAFAVKHDLDFVAASFVRDAPSVVRIRQLLAGSRCKIISKIENQQGMDNFDAILAESDGIMVARGDLGVEIPVQQVVIAQKGMIFKCNVAGKPVVTATQMLESMIKNPRPTRAEASDVANAVFDGTDCVMLSGETAKGRYPFDACAFMVRMAAVAEQAVDYREFFLSAVGNTAPPISKTEAVTSAAVKVAVDLGSPVIIVVTESGNTARYVSKYFPPVPVVAVTSDQHTASQLYVTRAAVPILASAGLGNDEYVDIAMRFARDKGWVRPGDQVVVVSGVMHGKSGATNMMRIADVPSA